MAYKYIQSSLPIVGKTPKEQYRSLFQETLNQQFYNAQNWYTIQEEYPMASKKYKDTDVRVAHLINAETGLKLGDDWKTLLFKEIDHNIEIGKLYYFDNNAWLTINTESFKNLTGTCAVKRCNNTLRWIDEATGIYYEEPCSLEYLVKEPRDYATAGSPFITPGGFMNARVQFNERTNKIRQNQRFMFGNSDHWIVYKVVGTGINAFNNMKTYDNMSAGIMVLDMIANYVNEELDDVVNGIADVNTNIYTLDVNPTVIEGNINSTFQLSTEVTYNGYTTTRDIEWSTSNPNVAIVSTSGLVTMKSYGTCVITAKIKGNPTSDTCGVTVTPTPITNTDVIISPDTNFILEHMEKTYSVYLYENGVVQPDTFTISCSANGISSENYIFEVIDGNHFKITNNKKDMGTYLTINCVSGSNSKSFDIRLKGGW